MRRPEQSAQAEQQLERPQSMTHHTDPDRTGDDGASAQVLFPPDLRRMVLETVERTVSAAGWDQPFSVVAVRWEGDPELLGDGVIATSLGFVPLLEGAHPYRDLPGRFLPPQYDAAVLVTEGWDYPDRLKGSSIEELEVLGPPSAHPERVEVRLLNFISRRGEEATLFLRYQSRDDDPETLFLPNPTGGRVRDVFRRYVGLPLALPPARSVELVGRFWTLRVLEALSAGIVVESVLEYDPLLSIPEFDSFEDIPPDAVEGFLLALLDESTWGQALTAARNGEFPVLFPPEILDWCDAGMFARMVIDETPSQASLLDGLLEEGYPLLAIELYQLLRARGWLDSAPAIAEPDGILADDAPCSCRSGRSFRCCHGRRRPLRP